MDDKNFSQDIFETTFSTNFVQHQDKDKTINRNINIAPYNSAGENASLESQIRSSAYDTSTSELNENYAISQEENVGDMVRSSYLILDERNVLDGNYQVQAWEENHPDYAYLITHDIANGLQDLHFEFKNMYL